jgi:hypothetical protein
LLTTPKSGSQWVRGVIFHPAVLAATDGLSFHAPLQPDMLDEYARLPERACSGPYYQISAGDWLRAADASDRAAILYRDPRDILVSWVFAMAYSHEDSAAVRCFREPFNCLNLRHCLMLGIPTQLGTRPTLTWIESEPARHFLLAKYEDLLERPETGFAAILRFFGWNVPSAILEKAIAENSFEARSGGRARGELNEQSHYRRGISGDWRTYFDRNLGELYESARPGELVRAGYETSDRWYEGLPLVNERLESDDRTAPAGVREMRSEIERLQRRNGVLESSYLAQRTLLEEYERLARVPGLTERA